MVRYTPSLKSQKYASVKPMSELIAFDRRARIQRCCLCDFIAKERARFIIFLAVFYKAVKISVEYE